MFGLLLCGLVVSLPGLVLDILISLAWAGGISLAIVVVIVTDFLLFVVLALQGAVWTKSGTDSAAAARLAQDSRDRFR